LAHIGEIERLTDPRSPQYLRYRAVSTAPAISEQAARSTP
jgi:hypothetical protein